MHRKYPAYRHKIFFVKDRVDKKEMKIIYCPTECMLADYLTKPLSESLFRLFRDIIMGHASIDKLFNHALKERVENTINKNEFNISAR